MSRGLCWMKGRPEWLRGKDSTAVARQLALARRTSLETYNRTARLPRVDLVEHLSLEPSLDNRRAASNETETRTCRAGLDAAISKARCSRSLTAHAIDRNVSYSVQNFHSPPWAITQPATLVSGRHNARSLGRTQSDVTAHRRLTTQSEQRK